MKPNFWQIVGVVLMVIGVIGMIWWHSRPDPANESTSPTTTQPSP